MPPYLVARFAITSFAFILELVPEPVWKTSSGNSSLRLLCQTSLEALEIALAFFDPRRFNFLLALAAASLINPSESTNELVKGKSIFIPLIGKFSTAL